VGLGGVKIMCSCLQYILQSIVASDYCTQIYIRLKNSMLFSRHASVILNDNLIIDG